MKSEKRIVRPLAAFALICGFSLVTHAQVGCGWSPGGETIQAQQTSSGCTITPIPNGYEFHSAASGRAENRWSGADLTTMWEWTGTCKIVSWPSGSKNTCIYQLWGSPSGDVIIDMAAGGGSTTNLMSLHDGDKVVATVPVGSPFNYAAVYNPSTAVESIYINGSQTGTTILIDSPSGHYDKNGSYVSNSGTGNDTVDWTFTSNWKGGNPNCSGFTINASAGSGGSINPNGAVNVSPGASQTFTITANSGFAVSSVTVDGANQGALTSFTFNNVQANHTIVAAFAPTSFTIAASAGTGGSISPNGNVVVTKGNSQTFTITPGPGFSIASVTVDGTNQGAIASYTFSNVQANHTIVAAFQSSTKQFTIAASAGTGGSISPNGNVLVNQGNSQTFTITPGPGFSIASVTVDGTNQGAIASYTFSNVQANHTIVAAFQSSTKQFTIAASAGTGGSISPNGNVLVNQGNSQIFTITPGSGYTISGVTVDGVNQGAIASYTFSNVQANHTIVAAFTSSGGCVTATVGGSWQNNPMSSETGTFTATFDATPSASPTNSVIALSNGAQTAYGSFACLVRFNPSGDIDARNGGAYAAASTIPYSANVSYHFSLVVDIAAQTYSIYVTPAGGSQITVGTNYAFRISDTTLNYWGVFVDNGSGGAGSDTVCNFAVTSGGFTITASAGSGGSITPSGAVPVAQGANQSFSITANSGSTISSVTVDGVNQGAISSYTFSNVQANHTISAAFTGSNRTLTGSSGDGWHSLAISPGATGTFTATYDATPSASPENAVIGLSNGAATAFGNLGCIGRFNPSGNIDAYNGTAYAAASTIHYSAGVSYHFEMDVNVTAHTYSIYVTPAGGSKTLVGSNYAFRSTANTMTSLTDWNLYVDPSNAGSLTANNLTP
jgi:hypothetical protein